MANIPVVNNVGTGTAQFSYLRGFQFLDPPTSMGVTKEPNTDGGAVNLGFWKGCKVARWVGPSGVTLFSSIRNQVRQSTDDGATWALAQTISTSANFQYTNPTTGLCFVTGSDNMPYLVAWNMRDDSVPGLFRASFVKFNGTSWSQFQTNLGAGPQLVTPYAHNGLVHFLEGEASDRSYTFDPVTNAFSTVNRPNGYQDVENHGNFFTLNKRLFYVGARASGNSMGLVEFTLGVWIGVDANFLPLINPQGSAKTRCAAVRVSDSEVLIFGSGNDGGFGLRAFSVTLVNGVPTANEVTTPVVPPFLRPGTGVGDPDDYGLLGYVDNTDPDNPDRVLFFCPDVGTLGQAVSLFRLDPDNPSSAQFTVVGTTQVTNEWSFPDLQHGGGQFIYTPGSLSIQIVDQIRDAQGLRIQYRCAGDPGTANKVASFRYVNNLGRPSGVCSLVSGSAVGGGTVVGNTVTGVDADPSIVHEVVWDFLANGVPDGSYLHDQAFLAQP